MNDRELLEAAAKAAGIESRHGEYWTDFEGMRRWNPLTDDGDALRLAVKLNLSIQSYPSWDRAQAWHPGSPESAPEEPHDTDPYAATRRAIVRAAAAIGEAA